MVGELKLLKTRLAAISALSESGISMKIYLGLPCPDLLVIIVQHKLES